MHDAVSSKSVRERSQDMCQLSQSVDRGKNCRARRTALPGRRAAGSLTRDGEPLGGLPGEQVVPGPLPLLGRGGPLDPRPGRPLQLHVRHVSDDAVVDDVSDGVLDAVVAVDRQRRLHVLRCDDVPGDGRRRRSAPGRATRDRNVENTERSHTCCTPRASTVRRMAL